MGKKAQRKRAKKLISRKLNSIETPLELMAELRRSEYQLKAEKQFQKSVDDTREVLRRYKRADAAMAINVSDLWPGNVASPVKHVFALMVLLSLENEIVGSESIVNYEDFRKFVEQIYAAWPDFPMLEDFIPEADWEQVKIRLGGEFVPMFYGSSIERTPDFVDAFRISYANEPTALAQMDLAIAIQASLINALSKVIESPLVPERGQIEVPSEEFWRGCRAALVGVGKDVVEWRETAESALEVSFGSYGAPLNRNTFGDAVMQGVALPFLAIKEGDNWIPVSVRNGPGMVIDQWAARNVSGVTMKTHSKLASFVAERFEETVVGPLGIVTGGKMNSALASCILSSGAELYVICACDHAGVKTMAAAVKQLYANLRSGKAISFRFPDGRDLMLSKDSGAGPTADEVRVLVVVTQSSTAFGMVTAPERPARMMFLADFISIFDSLSDFDELDSYWNYVDSQRSLFSPFSTGAADVFASFRDSHGVLVDGAMSPNVIALDPSWGTSWRFKELQQFWSLAPRYFPDDSQGWRLAQGTEGVIVMTSRHHPTMAYSTLIQESTVQAVVTLTPDVEIENVRLIDLFCQLLIDSMYRCRTLLSDAPLFEHSHLVIICKLDPATSTSREDAPGLPDDFPAVVVSAQISDKDGTVRLMLNAQAILAGLNDAKNASFEIRCLIETLVICHRAYGKTLPEGLRERLGEMAATPPRYHMRIATRNVDVPDFVSPVVPSATEYKLARRQLAFAMKDLGLEAGRYELAEAKTKIDAAAKCLGAHIEERLSNFDRTALVRSLLEQHDALLVSERMKIYRAQQSLAHQVEYDRLEAIEEARKELGSVASHYRYLLEKVLSSSSNGAAAADDRALRELVGLVDWYMVMKEASDVLHNELDVGGVNIDDSFIPEVFYSDGSEELKEKFAREHAKFRLGIELKDDDVVEGESRELISSQNLRAVFLKDVGFELQHLINTLVMLAQAQRYGFGEKLAVSYSSDQDCIVQSLLDNFGPIEQEQARRVVEFLTLSESGIRRLAGKDVEEPDVPYWEHKKRVHRYVIRPLVREENGLRWGAETASRAMNIWLSSVRDGYLPASFGWTRVEPAINKIKVDIEKRLELKTEEIFLRYTPYVVRGRDFYKTYRNEGFDDAGDFDVLAYWPSSNVLVGVECKYNQPPHTMKDGRRLRDQIFGKSEDDRSGQMSRILRRRQFAEKNWKRMMELLKWPVADAETRPEYVELCVSRAVYFWMSAPPYPVPTKFVRVDALDFWIQSELGMAKL